MDWTQLVTRAAHSLSACRQACARRPASLWLPPRPQPVISGWAQRVWRTSILHRTQRYQAEVTFEILYPRRILVCNAFAPVLVRNPWKPLRVHVSAQGGKTADSHDPVASESQASRAEPWHDEWPSGSSTSLVTHFDCNGHSLPHGNTLLLRRRRDRLARQPLARHIQRLGRLVHRHHVPRPRDLHIRQQAM
jgi:hypothetical protein